jgi:hypothetical protein
MRRSCANLLLVWLEQRRREGCRADLCFVVFTGQRLPEEGAVQRLDGEGEVCLVDDAGDVVRAGRA